jgi:hypothetical protein
MICYHGFVDDFGICRVAKHDDMRECFHVMLQPRNDLIDHSPDGFNWGYAGSGPAQLAFALLVDVLGEKLARRYYMAFKDWRIAKISQGQEWKLTRWEIQQDVAAISKAGLGDYSA